MKSLYNISGILPAQFRANPNDCGIAWIEHRRVEMVKREDVIDLPAMPVPAHIKEFIDKIIDENTSLTMDLISLRGKQGKAKQETLKPIDPKTIQVGDTVRLVGSRTIDMWPYCNLEVGKDYKVIYVDKDYNAGLSISVSYNLNGKYFWIYEEDLMLVESA